MDFPAIYLPREIMTATAKTTSPSFARNSTLRTTTSSCSTRATDRSRSSTGARASTEVFVTSRQPPGRYFASVSSAAKHQKPGSSRLFFCLKKTAGGSRHRLHFSKYWIFSLTYVLVHDFSED